VKSLVSRRVKTIESRFDMSIEQLRNRDCTNQSLGFQQENVVNPPAHKVFEPLVSFYRLSGCEVTRQ